ncbi:hypothetical protein SLEP1_g29380 [Rubroshorea leprosula]|uniref:Uncharacterized protein n=1 Tax=Rubroshorea leprosula TaxID=152421 RepID=A0AAV5K567_9ROSI|nr:hypothetical protein SLEP1_g29380 [Rubroshorea leprosula]
MDSPGREHPTSNLPRRKGSSNHSAESPMHDAAMPPKHSRQKKSSKESSGSGSTKPSRSKGQNSLSNVLELKSGKGHDDSQNSTFSEAHKDSNSNWSLRDKSN